MRSVAVWAGLALAATGCSADSSRTGTSSSPAPGLAGVGQGGAQDFGLFRQILEDGGIPGPETLDDVGFFNEHVLPLPAPECGDDVCLHGLYGTMGNMISGSPCTVLLLGMNSTLTPESVGRPPLNLTLVVDTSGSMGGTPINAVRRGLTDMLLELEEGDEVSLVTFDTTASVVADGLSPTDPALRGAFEALMSGGSTNIYDGLREGYALAESNAALGEQNRVLLLSDGMATAGLTSADRMLALSRAYGEQGFGLSTIGVGTEFDVQLMRDLAEQSAGAFYFVEDASAVEEVFREEVKVFLVPIAEQARIEVAPNGPWDLRGLYGTRLFELDGDGVVIDIPTLQLAGRTDPNSEGPGRRGGGGAILVELLPSGSGEMVGEVAHLDFRYRVPGTDDVVEQQISVAAPRLGMEEPWFEDGSVEKGFVMLNLFVGLRMAAHSAQRGDDGAALGVLDALDSNVAAWLVDNPDDDIADDLFYVDLFRSNLELRAQDPRRPDENNEPWPYD